LGIGVLQYQTHVRKKLEDFMLHGVEVINGNSALQGTTEVVRNEAVEKISEGRLPRAIGTSDKEVLAIFY
jgi:hypothetical protein